MSDWENQPNLSIFGEISGIDSSIKWPNIEVKQIFSPPKGRHRKNVHNILDSSSEGSSPAHKKTKMEEENTMKVHEFFKKLEEKQATKLKYTQAKLNFPASKSKSADRR